MAISRKTITTIYPKFNIWLYVFTLTLLLISFSEINAQGWGPFMTIYSNKGYTLKVSFRTDTLSCKDGEQPFAYKYRVNGDYVGSDSYINWSIQLIDCDGKLKRRHFSENLGKLTHATVLFLPSEYQFTCKKILGEVEKNLVTFGGMPDRSLEVLQNERSSAPSSIIGPNEIFYNQKVELKLDGGELGIGGKWVWYKDSCAKGEPVGTGPTLTIPHTAPGEYFVRAEGPSNITQCVGKKLVYNSSSSSPKAILGNRQVCTGSTLKYEADGGALGEGAEWAWYEGNCTGTPIKKGPENFIYYKAEKDVTLFIRAESPGVTTSCVDIRLKVKGKSSDPVALKGKSTICAGDELRLEIDGKLEFGSEWRLFEDGCSQGSPLKSNASGIFLLTPTPGTHTYFALAASECGLSKCVEHKVFVNKVTQLPTSLEVPKTIFRRQPFTASFKGGDLGTGAQWAWYYGESDATKVKIGDGTSVEYKTKKNGKIFLGSEGDACKKPQLMLSEYVHPQKSHNWHRFYNNEFNNPKIIQIGFNLGLETARYIDFGIQNYSKPLPGNQFISGTRIANMKQIGAGFKLGFDFHPLYTRYFGLGINCNYAFGPKLVLANTDTIAYQTLSYGITATGGLSKIKLLLKYQPSIDQYTMGSGKVGTDYTYLNNAKLYRNAWSFGFRFWGTERKDKRAQPGRAFDVYYTIQSASDAANGPGIGTYNQSGFGFQFWWQSRMKINFDLTSADYSGKTFKLDNSNFRLGISWQNDWFY